MSLLLSQQSAVWAATAALVEGADALLAQASPAVAASSAVAEGPDTSLAQLSPVVAANSAVTEGADALQAQTGPVSVFSAAVTDGADVLAAAVSFSAGVDVSAALAEGADVLAASFSVLSTVAFSAALLDGADTLASTVSTLSKTGGDDVPRVEIWTTRKAKAVRKRVKRELVALKAEAPELAAGLTLPAQEMDWSAYVTQLQAVAAQIDALSAWRDWLEHDDEEILLLL